MNWDFNNGKGNSIMKRILYISLSATASLFLFSCSKDAIDANNKSSLETKNVIEVTASIPERGLTATKVNFEEAPNANNKMRLTKITWKVGDKITIEGKTFSISEQADISNDGKTATFSGNQEPEPNAQGKYTVEYNDIPSSLNSQTQASDGSTDHLGYSITVVTDDYKNVSFASGTDKSSILQLRAQLPESLKNSVRKVVFKASQDVFNGNNQLTVTLGNGNEGCVTNDGILDVYATLPYGAPVTLSVAMDLLVQFQTGDADYLKYTAYRSISPGEEPFISSGKVTYLGLNCSNIESYANASNASIGSSSNPYLVGDQHQMQAMSGFLVSNQKKCFKLVDDVDMTDVAWSPLSGTSTFDKEVDFDGNGKTIDNLSSTGQYASFFGVLNGEAYDVTFDHATISSTKAKAAVVAAFLGSAAASVSASCHGITIRNSTVTNTEQYAGALSGITDMLSGPIDDCHVINTIVNGKGEDNNDARVGGLLGQLKAGYVCKNSTAEGVTVTGSKNVGGLIGVAYGTVQDCWSSGSVSSPNTTSDADIALGGLVGYFENGTITDCYSSVSINQTSNGRDIGGLVGKMLAGTIEKSYATGNVSGKQRNVGGLVGLVTLTSNTANIHDCYAWGNVNANAYSSGLIGLQEKGTVIVSNCYSTSSVVGTGFALGGIVGVAGSAALTVQKCVAWNSAITPGSHGSGNWSSGAVIGVTFPTCTLTDNYRNPSMALTAYWVPASNYQHANVSASAPLTDSTGAEMADTSTSKGQAHYPQYPYHGKVETGKTLSQLASTTLGWSSDVWDFSGPLPLLK